MSKISPFWSTWYTWKSIRLPWRKEILAGRDLEGNTYWEFNDIRHGGTEAAPTAKRMRRIVKYPRGTHPGSVMVPPMWHQWLRHVRHDPPSLQEQQSEVARQAQMRLLAAQADARWAGARRVEGPIQAGELAAAAGGGAAGTAAASSPAPQTAVPEPAPEAPEAPEPVHVHARQPTPTAASPTAAQPASQQKKDPWETARGAPGEQWQPSAWTPPAKK